MGLYRFDRAVHRLHRADFRRPRAVRLVDHSLHARLVRHHRAVVGGVHHSAAHQL